MPTLVANGAELYYEEYGSGTEFVLSAQNRITSGPESYLELLAKAGMHVYSIQLRGFGRSSPVTQEPTQGWYPVWAEDVYQFARTLKIERFIYTGISHGAGVGWNLVLLHPEALRAFVGVVGGPHDRSKPRTRGMGVGAAEINPGKVFPELNTNEEVAQRLSTVTVPTLLLNGAQDDIIPAEMSLLVAKSVPGAKMILYQEYGHSLPREVPQRVIAEIKLFLDELTRSTA